MRKNLIKTVSEGSGESKLLLEYYLLERSYFEDSFHARQKKFGISVRKVWEGGAKSLETEMPCVTNSLNDSLHFIEKIARGAVTPTSLVELIDDYFFFEEELALSEGFPEDEAAKVS